MCHILLIESAREIEDNVTQWISSKIVNYYIKIYTKISKCIIYKNSAIFISPKIGGIWRDSKCIFEIWVSSKIACNLSGKWLKIFLRHLDYSLFSKNKKKKYIYYNTWCLLCSEFRDQIPYTLKIMLAKHR